MGGAFLAVRSDDPGSSGSDPALPEHNEMISQLLIKKSHWSRRPSVGIAALLNDPLAVRANDALVLPKALGPTNTAILRPERKIESIAQLNEAHFWR